MDAMINAISSPALPHLQSAPQTSGALEALQSVEAAQGADAAAGEKSELRQAFNDFVGQTFYTQLLSSMRATVGKPAYFHGGRAEEVFQGQLDQILAERMTEADASHFTDAMYELFTLPRQ